MELAIALCVVAPCVLGAGLVGARRSTILAAAALTAAAGGVADAIAGSYVAPYVTGGDAPRLIGLAAVVAAAGGLWLLQRRALRLAAAGARVTRALAVFAVAVPLAGGLVAAAATPDSGPQAEPVSGFAHGRTGLWRAAIDTAEDRPLAGSGALSFGTASLRYQEPPPVRFAHNLPLESWAELGAAGALLALMLYVGSVGLVWSRRRAPRPGSSAPPFWRSSSPTSSTGRGTSPRRLPCSRSRSGRSRAPDGPNSIVALQLETMTYARDGRVARITLDRPERGNGITLEMPRELSACVERANLDPEVHAIALSGNGSGFCGGYDLAAICRRNR